MMIRSTSPLFAVIATFCGLGHAQQDVVIHTIPVSGNVSMLMGRGGNIGVSIGVDGAFMIDDQFAPLTDKILNAVRKLGKDKVRFLVNTHWHGDHTGGNENLGKRGAIIVAHKNVRQRMSTDQFTRVFGRKVPPSPRAALPVITFDDSVTFHWNDDTINVFHVKNAHTDGDAIIHFVKANVFHMGDVFFNRMYPFIDGSSSGSIDGVIAACDRVLKLANDKTKIIPGHGALATKADLRAYRDMLETVRNSIVALIQAGKTDDDIVAAKPTEKFDRVWGRGFMKPEPWTRIVIGTLRPTKREKN